MGQMENRGIKMKEFEMNEKELFERTNQVLVEHEEAKIAWKQAKPEDGKTAEEVREEVLKKYPNFKPGYLPRTPARKAFEALKVHCGGRALELADPNYVEQCERVILATPDSAEICYHVANKIREGAAWPAAESKIAESPWWAYMYASTILQGRFPAGETAIRSDEFYSERYDRLLA
jgi:hypothetical protein